MKKDLTPRDPNVSLTIAEFCQAEKIGLTTYYKLRQLGTGPREHCPVGTRVPRISPEALREYRERVTPIDKSPVRVAAREKSVKAAKKAIASPKHQRFRGKRKRAA